MLRTIRRAAAARLRVLHCLAAVLRRVTFRGVDPGRWCAAVLRTVTEEEGEPADAQGGDGPPGREVFKGDGGGDP